MKFFKRKRKFFVLIEWNYCGRPDERFEHCNISPASRKNKKCAGDNFIGCGGDQGMDCFISDSLEEAIINSNYNPFAIKFYGLKKHEKKEKDDFLTRCSWSYSSGLQISS